MIEKEELQMETAIAVCVFVNPSISKSSVC